MRTTKLLATLLVAALAIVACKQDEDYVLPSITLSTPTLDFSAATEQSIDLLATRDWQILGKPEWVQRVEPDHGPGTSTLQRIRLIADPNEGYNREDEIVFTIGLSKATLSISQPGAKGEIPVGTGTKDDPYTVKGVLRYIETLGADVESPQDVYIKGKISEITEAFSTQYGNASFKIKGDDGEVFTVYRALYLGNKKWTANDTQIQLNDEVVICGKVINFKGNTPETQQNKAYVYSLNGETQGSGGGGETGTPSGTGTLADPYNAAAAAAAVANLTWTSNTDYQTTDEVYVKGKICKIADNGKFAESGTNGNATFYISDDGTESGTQFYCYRVLYLGNAKYASGTDIKVGDDVIIKGKLMNYRGNTPETVAGKCFVYSLNGNTEASGGGGETTEIKTVTVAQFIAAEPSKTQKYQLTGVVTGNLNTQYGNFDLKDDTGTVYVYGLTKTDNGYGTKNDQSFASIGVKAGDTVTIIGYRETYKKEGQEDKVEVVYAYYVSHTAGSGGNEQGGSGTSSEIKTVTIAEFLTAPDSDTQKYQLTGKIANIVMDKTDSSKPNAYGNFDLVDGENSVYVYGLTKTEQGLQYDDNGNFTGKANNDMSFASLNLKEGDTLTLIGYHYTYKGSSGDKVEVLGAYYVSHKSGE